MGRMNIRLQPFADSRARSKLRSHAAIWAQALFLAVLMSVADVGSAEVSAAPDQAANWQKQIQTFLSEQPLQAPRSNPSPGERSQPRRFEVVLGDLDPRIRLAPCERVKAYLPQGAQLWGRTRVGVRCEQGSVRWNVYWPVQVKVFGQALVAAVPLRPGSLMTASDVALAEVDLAASGSPAVHRQSEVVGRAAARALAPGQSIRQDDLKARRWFDAGEPVRLNVKGAGFVVAAEGIALSPGDEGRCARVRTDQGRILCGQPVGERLVEVKL